MYALLIRNLLTNEFGSRKLSGWLMPDYRCYATENLKFYTDA